MHLLLSSTPFQIESAHRARETRRSLAAVSEIKKPDDCNVKQCACTVFAVGSLLVELDRDKRYQYVGI